MTNASSVLPHVFAPMTVGTMALDHRLVVPPHGGGNGNLVGSPDEFEQHCALWLAKVHGGMQWIGGGPNFVRNPLPAGFEPTGVGSHGPGFFRNPLYSQRIGEFADRVHSAGGFLSVQMVLQGGMPIAPSATFSGYSDHRIAHALDLDEVAWLVREYGESAAIAADAGIDAIEIHANHDDVVQWFLSAATNHRDDAYGGTFENRRRLLVEVVDAIRSRVDRPITFGLRLCLDEMIDGGYGVDECQRLIEAFTADGQVDYFSLDVGSNWGAPSYIPIGWHDDHEWSPLCGVAKQATHLPVVYAGRVTTPEQAEHIIAAGQADLVAMARATMADPELVMKTRAGRSEHIRPCIGLNECIHRKLIDGITYACGTNPAFARERTVHSTRTTSPRSILVVGGGPGGSELAALCAEHGHQVQLWERNDHLGGALAVATKARGNHRYQTWIDWQTRRLADVGVTVQLGRTATADDVMAERSDLVVIATGATPRWPDTPGITLAHVVQAADVLTGRVVIGHRVALVVEDDGPAPVTVADHLAALGHQVTMVFQTPAPSPLVGKYSVGAMLARLDLGGVVMVPMARTVAVDATSLTLAHSYSNRRWEIGPFDSVVLACGSVSNDSLYHELRNCHADVRLLGDAYAPRRMVFATRQAWQLALDLD
jgi:2,4-dienoyl-CoA reductase-like NADH-dependent reductase (Old Yellow Enzyme family)/thioredoxin reductase